MAKVSRDLEYSVVELFIEEDAGTFPSRQKKKSLMI